MGSAQSSNVSSAVADVSNFVTNSTSANQNQANAVYQDVIINQCNIKVGGNFTTTEYANSIQTSRQQISAQNDNNLQNNIAQATQQVANSKVGTLGIGFANASNSANELVNDRNQIVNSINAVSNQYNTTNQNFICDNSYIQVGGNLDLDFSTSAQFLSDQVLNQTTTNQVVNDVSQTIKQKATATVEGLASLLLVLGLIIGIIIYSLGKTLDTGPVKLVVGILAVVLIVALISWCYVGKKPPFFNTPDQCIPGSPIGGDSPCINVSTQSMNLKSPPVRYLYDLSPSDNSQVNLVQMLVASYSIGGGSSPGSNGGYRIDILQSIQNDLNGLPGQVTAIQNYMTKYNIPMIPNPLIDPGTIYPTNNPASPYYSIPVEYITATSSNTGAGLCTPGTVEIGPSNSPVYQPNNAGMCVNRVLAYTSWENSGILPYTDQPDMAVANLNSQNWQNYLYGSGLSSDDQRRRALFARFVIGMLMQNGTVDLSFYLYDDELTRNHQGQVAEAGNNQNVYKFIPGQPQTEASKKISGPGTISGPIGVFDTNEYKFQNFMKKIGGWIILALLILPLIYMGYTTYKNRKAKAEK